ncbi:DUF952 domain-containing protein [Novosphingobium sp.]|uniref:DUF952 domain-containing protein n=1 Tax=Novosphingobium sp. TaxID=1874826 RepID=UPI002FDA1CF2
MSELSAHEAVAYKILSSRQLKDLLSAGTFAGAPVDIADGYIHLSTLGQVKGTLDKHFAGQDDLHIAAVDLAVLADAVKWEVSRGGALFPHLYAVLPLSAVIAHGPITFDRTGALLLPDIEVS